MTKISIDDFDALSATPHFSVAELMQLKAILKVVRYDEASETLRIDTGKARILVRGDGSVRIEGRRVTQVADGAIVLNGATIELN